MSPAASVPRPDQIAELTRDIDFPLEPIDDVYLFVIADGIARAFNDIRISSHTTVATGGEAEVTALLEARLNSLISEDRLWRQLVRSVARGKETVSFDGTHLEKRPDLSIYLTARLPNFPLVAEAKIIDAVKGEILYCSQGLQRFLNGEYGWAGREAFMVAYVRDFTTIATRLTPYLSAPAQMTSYAVQTAPASLGLAGCDAARSKHDRSFLYAHMAPPANFPGAIELWHLWVDAS